MSRALTTEKHTSEADRSRWTPGRWAVVYLAGGAGALIVYFFVLGTPFQHQVAYLPFGWAAATVTLWTARKRLRERQPFFLLLGAGIVSFVCGDALWMSYHVVRHTEPPYPSLGDPFWMAAYVFWAAAIVVLIRQRTRGRDRGAWIDSSIILVAAGLLGWVFMIEPTVMRADMALLQKATAITYPGLDVLLIGLAARLIVAPGARTPAFRMLVSSFVALLAADISLGLLTQQAAYQRGNLIDLGWLGAYVLWGALAFEPSATRLSGAEPTLRGVSRARLVALTTATLIAPATAIYVALGDHHSAGIVVTSAAATALFLLVLVRMWGLVGALDRSLRELRESEEQRRRLFAQSVRAGEEERTRLAAELHNGPVQSLTVLALRAQRALSLLKARKTRVATETVRSVRDGISQEIDDLRRMMTELRPPVLDERGLEAAVRDHARSTARSSGLKCRVAVHLPNRPAEAVETVLYRVAQEALANAVRHADASSLEVRLRAENGSIRLAVRDDGVGFEMPSPDVLVKQGRFGLLSMRERVELAGGECEIESLPGKGTTVRVSLPAEELAA